jgi:hypothetical protein
MTQNDLKKKIMEVVPLSLLSLNKKAVSWVVLQEIPTELRCDWLKPGSPISMRATS